MYPVNIDWWIFHVRGYEGHWAVGTLLLGFFYQRYKSLKAGYSNDWFISAYSFSIITGMATARLFHFLFWDTQAFLANPLIIFKATGGFAILGGTIGTGFGGWVYCKYTKVNFLHWCDSLMLPISICLAISRFSCFLNGDAYGIPTGSIFGVAFSENSDDFMAYWRSLHPMYALSDHPLAVISQIFQGSVTLSQIPLPHALDPLRAQGLSSLADLSRFYGSSPDRASLTSLGLYPFPVIYPRVHPAQLYEALIMLGVYLLLVRLEKSPLSKQRQFFIFWFFYGLNRFFIEFFRMDRNVAFGGLTYAQIVSIVLIVFGAGGWFYFAKKWKKTGVPAFPLK